MRPSPAENMLIFKTDSESVAGKRIEILIERYSAQVVFGLKKPVLRSGSVIVNVSVIYGMTAKR